MCKCIEEINGMLRPKGQSLNISMGFRGDPDKPLIGLIRTDKFIPENRRHEAKYFFPTFCPFCGVRYDKPEVAEPAKETA